VSHPFTFSRWILKSHTAGNASASTAASESDQDSDDDHNIVPETDTERRKALQDSEAIDLSGLKAGNHWNKYDDDFIFTGQGSSEPIELSSDEDILRNCDTGSGSTFVTGPSSDGKGKRKQRDDADDKDSKIYIVQLSSGVSELPTDSSIKLVKTTSTSNFKKPSDLKKGKGKLGNLAKSEVEYRKKEALGLAPGNDRTLGGSKKQTSNSTSTSPVQKWACLVCTLCVSIFNITVH
jgi:hypothetical protein